jgi:hypothetical protein
VSIEAELGYVLCRGIRFPLHVFRGGQSLSMAQSAASQERYHHRGHRGHGEQTEKKLWLNKQGAVIFTCASRNIFLCGLCALRGESLTQKDVKNEDRSDYVNENKGEIEKMDENPSRFSAENARIRR